MSVDCYSERTPSKKQFSVLILYKAYIIIFSQTNNLFSPRYIYQYSKYMYNVIQSTVKLLYIHITNCKNYDLGNTFISSLGIMWVFSITRRLSSVLSPLLSVVFNFFHILLQVSGTHTVLCSFYVKGMLELQAFNAAFNSISVIY